MSKLLFFDLETTGVDNQKNGIHQLSGIIEIDGEIKETFNLKTCPFSSDIIEDEALKIGNVSRETIQAYESPQTQKKAFDDILSKYVDKFNKPTNFTLQAIITQVSTISF
jgi:DNA polymerase-3 subunit epsilon